MKSRAITAPVIFVGLALTGFALRPVETSVWVGMHARESLPRSDTDAVGAEQAVVGGLLGGFRAPAADFLWLEVYGAAAEHDLPATESLLYVVTVIDPRPLYFWLNGARIMAYDMPAWRIEAAGGYDHVPAAVQRRIGHEQARRALKLLEEARRFHPASAALWIERANIELNRLGDPAAAAESYRRAWEQPAAPYYAARLHAELLRRLGRRAEALAWLVKLHPHLPPGEESAGAGRVLARIRDLEHELSIPVERAYRPVSRAGL